MLNLSRLCASFEEAVGWPYVSPGTNDENGIDCSGMFVRAYRLQGSKIYHGSNAIYRNYCIEPKGKLYRVAQLKVGYAVFKWTESGAPSKYNDGLGNFHHIGLVTSVNPLRIVHASTDGMRVRVDTSLKKWTYYGKLKDVGYDEADDEVTTTVSVSEVTTTAFPTLKKGSKGSAVQALQAILNTAGASLTVDGDFGSNTKAAVIQYQKEHGLKQDGIVGSKTWTMLLGG